MKSLRRKILAFTLSGIAASSLVAAAATPEPGDAIPPIAGWDELMEGLQALPSTMLAKLPKEMRDDPQVRQEVARLILQSLTLSSITALGSDGDHPQFLPSLGQLLNVGQPNADTIYKTARITPGGTYRLQGYRGSLNQAIIGQVGPTPADAESDGKGPGATKNYLELSTLQTDDNGNFDVILSPVRPSGYSGDWWPLHPKTYSLMLRQVSSDWANERDPTISIERLDGPAERDRPGAEAMEMQLRRLPVATAFMAAMFVDKVEQLRSQGFVNKLNVLDVSQIGGLDGQFYYEGAYDLGTDDALIIESRVPESCGYRSIILTNEIYQTTDWYNNQSSLNDSQALPDSDGILRVVVAAKDPGVPNWLDTAGYPKGVIQGRWTHCDSQPIPTVTRVQVDQVRDHLPADTPVVTPKQREATVRARRLAYQLRRHW